MPHPAGPSPQARADRAPPARRAFPRYPSNRLAACQAVTAGREEAWVATIRDVSGGGLGLLAGRGFPVGALLLLDPLDAQAHSPRPLLARVRRAAAQGDGSWLLGCELVFRLGYDKARELRGGPSEAS